MKKDKTPGRDSGRPARSGGTDRATVDSADIIGAAVGTGPAKPVGGTERAAMGTEDIVPADVQGPLMLPPLGSEIVLNNERYTIVDFIAASGEAESYRIRKGNRSLVLKLYYHRFAPKPEIMQALKGVQHDHIIQLVDYGQHEGRFFEVKEYAEGGSLDPEFPIRDAEVLKQLIAEILDGFAFCHSKGIIHRDIKPQNLFFKRADGSNLAIGDFGIATALTKGSAKKFTGQARTAIYAAPELFQGIAGKTVIDKGVDYYALGITLIHIWTGKEPFEDVSDLDMMSMKIEGRVRVPDDLPQRFSELVRGLITVEPPKRWGYEEVQKWLGGERVEVHHSVYRPEYKELVFGVIEGQQVVVCDAVELADWMDRYPDIGARLLYKKGVSKWVERANPGLFAELESIVDDEYPRDQTAGLTKAMYVLDPDRSFKGIDEAYYSSEEELADCLERNFDHYQTELRKPSAPLYLFLEARGYSEEAGRFRQLFKSTVSSRGALNSLILSLQGKDTFVLGRNRATKPEELLALGNQTRIELTKCLRELDTKLSIWIQGFPQLKDSIDRWRALGRFDDATFRYALRGGFEFQGEIARDTDQVKALLKKYPKSFDWQEANYWLKNYMNASLNELIVDVLSAGEFADDEFHALSSYALRNHDDLKRDIFQSLEDLLAVISRR